MEPVRTCIACRRRRTKRELLRLAVEEGRTVIIDRKACAPGRGRYVCPERRCIESVFSERRRKREPALSRLTSEEADHLARQLIEGIVN